MNTKELWLTTVTIYDQPRRALWEFVFSGGRVPIKSIIPCKVNVPGHQNVDAYMLDLDAISDFQRDGLITVISARFNIPWEEVKKDIGMGVPILAEGVIVSSTDQGLVFSMLDVEDDNYLLDEHEQPYRWDTEEDKP